MERMEPTSGTESEAKPTTAKRKRSSVEVELTKHASVHLNMVALFYVLESYAIISNSL